MQMQQRFADKTGTGTSGGQATKWRYTSRTPEGIYDTDNAIECKRIVKKCSSIVCCSLVSNEIIDPDSDAERLNPSYELAQRQWEREITQKAKESAMNSNDIAVLYVLSKPILSLYRAEEHLLQQSVLTDNPASLLSRILSRWTVDGFKGKGFPRCQRTYIQYCLQQEQHEPQGWIPSHSAVHRSKRQCGISKALTFFRRISYPVHQNELFPLDHLKGMLFHLE